ncbi:enoyl-CoA hydratase/isomerase family protein [Pseudonocardia nigra]|uniref:enoyl-CoA hydratase/isomerase family protein n=1 Tax=Pseudonocardia nigra TaxID=1921578 RepID=UPI0027E23F83|nr:enoyl-CoA hydratase/isomerase family protein [Pseudonocardia nigra]
MIEYVDEGDVAVLRLAHGKVSAMDMELCEAIAERFRALATDPARAVVLTGTDHTFSAGVDLRRYLDEGEPYVRRFLPALADAFRAAFELSKPVVAAVNGHAIAGGCVLAACADVTLMADGDGRIGVPEIKVGVPFPRMAVEVLRYAVGDVAARRLILGARTHRPRDAQAVGLVDEVVPVDELLPRAVEAARSLAADVPPDTFAAMKAQLRREALERTDRYADEEDAVTALWSRRATDGWTADYLAAVTRR